MVEADGRLKELSEKLARLRAELDSALFQIKEGEKSRKAMLYLLDDLNKSTAEVERGKEEWEATFDAISDPLFIHDNDMRLVRVNSAYLAVSGMAGFRDILGKPYYEVFPKMDGPFSFCRKAYASVEGGAPRIDAEAEETVVEMPLPHQRRVFKVRFYPINDRRGNLLYSIHILEDVTAAKLSEERIREEMEITSHLLKIADVSAQTTDLDRLMEQITGCISKILDCEICLSYLWDEETKTLRPSQAFGLAHEMIPVFRTGPLDAETAPLSGIMAGKSPVVVKAGANANPVIEVGGGCCQWLQGMDAVAVIPLIGKAGALGVIMGVYKAPREIMDRDKKIMAGISSQVSVALEQARLYRDSVDKTLDLSHRIETIKVMNEIDRSILSTLNAEEMIETVTRLTAKVVPCDFVKISLVDREMGGIIYKAGFGTSAVSKGALVPFADTSARAVIDTGRAESISNMSEMTPLLPLEKKLLDEGVLSCIRAPINIKEDVAGIFAVGARRAAAFSKDDLSTIESLGTQIGVALENSRLIIDLEELYIGVVKSLSSAIDAKSPWTAGHSERVARYAVDIAREMGMQEKELKDIELAGLLHDVGKIGTYEAVLNKPAKLNDEEMALLARHPARGAEILAPIKQLKNIISGVKYHHEFYDGTGYPEKLKGEGIPLFGRILTVADTVDAMGADRPYRKGRTMDAIVAELKRCSGTQFDPGIVEAFLKTEWAPKAVSN